MRKGGAEGRPQGGGVVRYAQLAVSALQYIDSRPEGDRATYQTLAQALRDRYEGEMAQQRAQEQLRQCKRGKGESLDDLGTRIKELARKGYPSERREEVGIAALKSALSLELAKAIVLHGYRTVDEAILHLTGVEVLREQKAQHFTPQAGKVRQIAGNRPDGSPQGKGASRERKRPAEEARPERPKGKPVTPGMEYLMRKLQEEMRAMGAQIRTLQTKSCSYQGTPGVTGRKRAATEGTPQGTPVKHRPLNRSFSTGPSAQNPCHVCGSDKHWKVDCPNRDRDPLNGKGLDSGSSGQSQQ